MLKTHKKMKVIHSNVTANLTHAILAPDTAMLKPICFFPCPFDTPLTSGLNFLRISDAHKSSKNYKRPHTFCYGPSLPSSGANMHVQKTRIGTYWVML